MFRPGTLRLALAAALALPSALAAQAGDPSGRWEGAISLPTAQLAIDVDLRKTGDAWSGDITIPQQNARDVALTGVAVRGDSVFFEIPGVPGQPTFRGALAADGGTLAGTFTQGSGSFPFSLRRGAGAAQASQAALEGWDAFVTQAMKDWEVPGMSIAVVKDGEVVLLKGYGLRDVEANQPVTPQTLFAIGSSTKAFTTFAMGRLVDQGKLEWDRPAITYLPGLKLHDEYATAHLTPRDMVTHRSGLPRHDLTWYNNTGLQPDALFARLPELVPSAELRTRFQYNNVMYVMAGHLLSRVTGKSWEESIRELVFQPLGMTASNFSVLESQRAADFAVPYAERRDTLRRLPFRDIRNVGPAGAINSTAEDMAKWVMVHLNRGKAGGAQLVAGPTLADMHAPHTVIPGFPTEADLSPRSYGLGWFIDTYRGHYRVEHGGNIDGFTALVTLFPHDNTGIVVLSNKNGTPLPQYVVRHLADRFFGLERKDWSGQALARARVAEAGEREGRAREQQERRPGTRPAHALSEYAGEYEHPGYGILTVAQRGSELAMRFSGIETPLEHWHYEVFNGRENPEDPTFARMKVQFNTGVDGHVESLSVPLEPSVERIVFARRPDAQLLDPAYLRRFVGEYRLGPTPVRVELNGNVLRATVPGQPTYDLEPRRNNEFSLKTLNGYRLQFIMDAQGRVTEALFKQPNGLFPAKRVESPSAPASSSSSGS